MAQSTYQCRRPLADGSPLNSGSADAPNGLFLAFALERRSASPVARRLDGCITVTISDQRSGCGRGDAFNLSLVIRLKNPETERTCLHPWLKRVTSARLGQHIHADRAEREC